VKRRNPHKRRFRGTEDPAYSQLIAAMFCTVGTKYGCFGHVIAHHDPTKATGGKDRGGTTPLCFLHHTEVHTIGRRSFDVKYGVNLRELGPILAERLKAA
jgi:hypothetical protein